MRAIISATMMFFCFSVAGADEAKQDTPLISEEAYLDDVPQAITVSRLSQPLKDAPSAVTVIDRATIKASGIVDLPEVFRLVPGFYVGTNAGYLQNTNAVVSYHGMTDAYSRRMQVLIDGRSVYEPLYGGVQWSELPIAISDIERIEITRGPNTASYGANSFLGVINIITQTPGEFSGNNITTTQGAGRHETFYKYGAKLNDLTYRLTIGNKEDDGLQNRDDSKRTTMVSARGDLKLTDRDNLELHFGYTDGTRQEGMLALDALVFLPRTKNINNHFEMIKWRRNLENTSDLQVQAYHAYNKIDDDITSVNLSPLFSPVPLVDPYIRINNLIESERYDVEVQHTFTWGESTRIAWGGSVRQDRTTAPRYLNTEKADIFNLQRLFAQGEWHITPQVVLNSGAMLEHNDFTGTDISPRASINYSPLPTQTFRLGISTALRTPTYLEEKFYTGVSLKTATAPSFTLLRQYFADKGGLDPERIISQEIGYIGDFGNLTLDMRIFHDEITDIIRQLRNEDFIYAPGVIKVDGRPFTYENAGSTIVNGLELQMQWKLGTRTRFIGSYAHTRIRPSGPLERDFEDSAPDNAISGLLTQRFNNTWHGSLAYYQTSATAALGDGNMVNLIRRWDGRVAKSFDIGRWHGELAANVQNMFNNHYEEFAYYNTLGRRSYLSLTLDF